MLKTLCCPGKSRYRAVPALLMFLISAAPLLAVGPSEALEVTVNGIRSHAGTAAGAEKTLFRPAEGIGYTAAVTLAAPSPFKVRLKITGDGWYEALEAGPFANSRTIEFGTLGSPLHVSGNTCSGKVSLFLEVESTQGEDVIVKGSPHGYFTVQCPVNLPDVLDADRLPTGTNPWDMAVSSDNGFLYVTSQERRTITVIRLPQWKIVTVLPEGWVEINKQISDCKRACPQGNSKCLLACVADNGVVGKPAGVVAAPDGRMVVTDYELPQFVIVSREGNDFALTRVPVPYDPNDPNDPPPALSDVVINPGPPSNAYACDARKSRLYRMGLVEPYSPTAIAVKGMGAGAKQILLDPLAPNTNVYVLVVDVFKVGLDGTMRFRSRMNQGPFSIAMAMKPAVAGEKPGAYVLLFPSDPADITLFGTSTIVYYWNPTPPFVGSEAVLYNKIGVWALEAIGKGDLKGKVAYAADSYLGQIRLLDLATKEFLACCYIPASQGSMRLLEDPVRNCVYVGNFPGGFVERVCGE